MRLPFPVYLLLGLTASLLVWLTNTGYSFSDILPQSVSPNNASTSDRDAEDGVRKHTLPGRNNTSTSDRDIEDGARKHTLPGRNNTSISDRDIEDGAQKDILPACNWPPPLYPNSPKTPPRDEAVMSKVQQWAEEHRNDSFVYLFEGGLVGMYRDGGLIPGDEDIDVVYHVEPSVDKTELKRLLRLEKLSSKKCHLSLQTDRFKYASKYSLCKPKRSPLQTLEDARARVEFRYGPHWFIKMPWKCQVPWYFFQWSRPDPRRGDQVYFHGHWSRSVKIIKSIDTDKDKIVTTQEVDAHVIKDGIDVTEYRRQITPRDLCRAAAMLTWILKFDKNPFPIRDELHQKANHPLFKFPKCEGITAYSPNRRKRTGFELPDCNWPPPLYPDAPETNQKDIEVMSKVQQWATDHQNSSFLYLYKGGLLEMYRDGGFITKDGDIDIFYEIDSSVKTEELQRLLDLENESSESLTLELQKDTFNYSTKYSLCKPHRSPLQTLNNTKDWLEFRYGPHWFVKMKWLGQTPSYFFKWALTHKKWRKGVRVVQDMDTDNDHIVTTQEVDAHVIKDGIDVTEYRRQITPRDLCRAAAMLTWILKFDKKPFPIRDYRHQEGNHPLFKFPKCDGITGLQLPDCYWPPPLYPNSPETNHDDLEVISKVQKWAIDHQNRSYLYLYERGLLEMYRDGGFITGDGDIHIFYEIDSSVKTKELQSLLDLEKKSSESLKLSFQTDRFHYSKKYSLCKSPRSLLQTLDNARDRLEFLYGPHWFVRMQWLGQVPSDFFQWAKPDVKNNERILLHDKWRKSVKIVQNIDTNDDHVISTREIDDHVIKDGIDYAEYNSQITSRDKCRAAVMLTWILKYNEKPFEIPDENHMEGDHTLFRFPECDAI